jgi:hypothetical protein
MPGTPTSNSPSVVPLAQMANDLTWPFSATLQKHLSSLVTTSGTITGTYLTVAIYDPASISQQVVGLTATQTLTNKTLTSPTINRGTTKATVPITVASSAASGTTTFDLSTGNVQNFSFSGSSASDSVTFALSNVTTNQIFIVSVTQNSGGSGTVTWFSTIRWPGGTGPTLTTTANKRDTFGFVATSTTTFDGYVVAQNI